MMMIVEMFEWIGWKTYVNNLKEHRVLISVSFSAMGPACLCAPFFLPLFSRGVVFPSFPV